MKQAQIFYGCIIGVCIIAIISVVIVSFTTSVEEPIEEPPINLEELVTNFNEEFDNTIKYQSQTNTNIVKLQDEKELVFVGYEKNRKTGIYEIKVSIPKINIDTSLSNEINSEIKAIFQEKTENIMADTREKTIYTVDYKAYINDNILSLAIRSTLKEGDNPQRIIIKTYNYNLSTNRKINLIEMLQVKNLTNEYVQNRINNTIIEASKQAEELKNIGYTIYERNLKNSMYTIQETQEFFLGKDRTLYLVYPYGNLNYTSEFDVVEFE